MGFRQSSQSDRVDAATHATACSVSTMSPGARARVATAIRPLLAQLSTTSCVKALIGSLQLLALPLTRAARGTRGTGPENWRTSLLRGFPLLSGFNAFAYAALCFLFSEQQLLHTLTPPTVEHFWHRQPPLVFEPLTLSDLISVFPHAPDSHHSRLLSASSSHRALP